LIPSNCGLSGESRKTSLATVFHPDPLGSLKHSQINGGHMEDDGNGRELGGWDLVLTT